MYNILMYNNILIIIYKNILKYYSFLFYMNIYFIFSNFQVKLSYNIYYHEVTLNKIKTVYIS